MSTRTPGDSASALLWFLPPARTSVSLGLKNAYLFTLVDNARAQRFYKTDQWTADGLERTETVWGIAVHVLRFQRNL